MGLTRLEQVIADGVQEALWEHGDSAMGALCVEHKHRNIKPKDCTACIGISAAGAIREAVGRGHLIPGDFFPSEVH